MEKNIVSMFTRISEDIKAKPPVEIFDGDGIILSIPLPEGRSQMVIIVTVKGRQSIRFFSPIGRYQNLNATVLLEFNMQLVDGAFAKVNFDLFDGLGNAPTLVLVDCQRIDTADYMEIKDKLLNIAVNADDVEKIVYGTDHT